MLPVVLGTLRLGAVRRYMEEPVLEQVERAVIGPAESLAGHHPHVEDRLDPSAAGDGAQDPPDRALLFADVHELASELGIV